MSNVAHVIFATNRVIYAAWYLVVEEHLTLAVSASPFPAVIAVPSGNLLDQPDDRRCMVSRNWGRWTLQADCELSMALDLPGNVTLDGGGHTITLAGDAEGFESAAIRATGGDIVHLTVDGSNLLPLAPAYFAAVTFRAPGRIMHTTVRNVRFDGPPHSAIGIEMAAFDGAVARVQDVTLENISGTGLLLTGDGQIAAERVRSAGVTAAVQVGGTMVAQLSHAVIEGADVGVLAQDQSCVRINLSDAMGERVAVDQALIHQGTLTFIGARDREQARQRATSAVATPHDRLG